MDRYIILLAATLHQADRQAGKQASKPHCCCCCCGCCSSSSSCCRRLSCTTTKTNLTPAPASRPGGAVDVMQMAIDCLRLPGHCPRIVPSCNAVPLVPSRQVVVFPAPAVQFQRCAHSLPLPLTPSSSAGIPSLSNDCFRTPRFRQHPTAGCLLPVRFD